MKKLIKASLLSATAIVLVACASNTESEPNASVSSEDRTEKTGEEDRDNIAVPRYTGDLGEGSFYLFTDEGTSEADNIPVLYFEAELFMSEIGFLAKGFDGTVLTYVFLDDTEIFAEEIGFTTSSYISLSEDNGGFKTGIHTVQFVQFAGNDTDSKPITVKTAQYEVKPA